MWRQELFNPHGSSPLGAWDVVGTTKRKSTPRMGFVLEMLQGSPPCRLSLPKKAAPRLNLRHRLLILEVHTDPTKPFSIEIGLCDTGHLSRVLTLAAGCKAPELAKGGGAKAKLPLLSVAPAGVDASVARTAGWRLVVLDLDYLTRRAFDGAYYAKLESVALVGSGQVLSVAASAEPPQVPPPGPVRLVASFGDEPPLPPATAPPAASEEDPATVRAAEREFIVKAHKGKVSAEAVASIPAVDGAEPPASAMPGRLQAAVRRVNMVTGMRRASGHRVGDPRDHLTTRGATGDGLDDATIYKRVQPAVGGEVADEVARVRGGFAEAQELARKLRWGIAGAVADLSGVAIGEGGARMLSFVLPKARALREIRLNDSGIGDGGVAYIASALRTMTTTRHIDMRNCRITSKGATALAAAIDVGCIGVRCVLLGNNELGSAGVAAIANALPSHATLTRLDLERTGAGQGLTPLFRAGDAVSFAGAHVVHARTGRRVPRADGGDAGKLEGLESKLHAIDAPRLGQLIDLRKNGKPPRDAAFVNAGSNAAVEALSEALSKPLAALRFLHLGGNFGAPTHKELRRVLAAGPNGPRGLALLQLKLESSGDAGAEAEAEAATAALAEVEAAAAAAREAPTDEEVALTLDAKMRSASPTRRPGTLPPEPSFASVSSVGAPPSMSALGDDESLGSLALEDDDEDDFPPEDDLPDDALRRSQTMGRAQSIAFALTGARVSAQQKPMAPGDGW